ncbi:MAG: hypothetical protein V9G19_13570 [Tetrasphaera sp.]
MDLSGLLSAKVNVKAELRQDESFVAAMQAYLGGRVSQLSDEADRVVQELSNRLREVWERQGRPWSGLVVLFDSLDHVRGTDFSEVRRALQTLFDQHGSTIRLSSARMVFVVPQWLHLDGGVRRVVNVKIAQEDGTGFRQGIALRELVVRRVPGGELDRLFARDSDVDFLLAASGGHLRDLLHLLLNASSVTDQLPFGPLTLERAIQLGTEQLTPIADDERACSVCRCDSRDPAAQPGRVGVLGRPVRSPSRPRLHERQVLVRRPPLDPRRARPAAAREPMTKDPVDDAWARLRRHLDRSRSFWFGVVVTSDARLSDELRSRAEWNRQRHVQPFVILRPTSASALADSYAWLERNAAGPGGCTWLETSPTSAHDTDWLRAWDVLAAELNHRRERMRHAWGGLILILPEAAKTLFQHHASDLWSIIDLLVTSVPMAGPSDGARTRPSAAGTPAPVEGVGGRAALTQSDDEDWVDRLRHVLEVPPERLLQADADTWRLAADEARRRGDGFALGWLYRARAVGRAGTGDGAGAIADLRSGLDVPDLPADVEAALRSALLNELWLSSDRAAASAEAQALLQLREDLNARIGGPQEQRDLSVCLNNVGRVHDARADWDAALAAYTRADELLQELSAAGRLQPGDLDWLGELRSRTAGLADRTTRQPLAQSGHVP